MALATVERRAIPLVYESPGHVMARESIAVASRITGFVEQVAVEIGDVVEKGALLVALDDTQIERSIAEAEAALAAARLDMEDARRDVAKYQALLEKQTGSRERLEKSRLRLDLARVEVERATAVLRSLKAERVYIRMVSPFKARITGRSVDPGALATVGAPLLHLERVGQQEFETRLPRRFLGHLAPAGSVMIRLDGGTEWIRAIVSHVVEVVDPNSGTGLVRAILPEALTIPSGTFGTLHLTVGHDDGMVVPKATLTLRAGVTGCFQQTADGTLRFRAVRTGRNLADGQVEIHSGLNGDEELVVDPPRLLRDGDRMAMP
ncbi:efflux RND transporter periplasmic adaptor subunit [Magnetofaba australis]|uniref:efflux RND transporter periplasmic adaptor subunit n=1 Tax=Magnetofaba australis TaxID=1472297 RepID=UPI001301B9F6|nr:efflux RND transporter periplasmic adaptor subunit [Magnetofaba australis]